MGTAARAHAEVRRERRERLGRQFPTAEGILSNRPMALWFLEVLRFNRAVIEQYADARPDFDPTRDYGVANHDAVISLIKDGLGLVTLTDAEFETAFRLATSPECRETLQ